MDPVFGHDTETKYFKVKHGIKFTNSSHNIYDIKESTKVVILYKIVKVKKR